MEVSPSEAARHLAAQELSGIVTLNTHNIYTHKSLKNITILTVWKNLQANGAYVSIKSKLT
jgi:hypothetical protein